MNETHALNPTDRLAELEAEKVRIEIGQLNRPAHKRIAFWTGIIVPLVLGTGGLITGEITGFFDDQLAKLEQEKRELRNQVELMNTSVLVLSAHNESLQKEKEEVTRNRDQLVQEKTELVQAKNALERDKTKLHGELSNLNAAIEKHSATVEKLEAESSQLRNNAELATEELGSLFNDLGQLLGEKGELYILVEDTPMDETRKQELRERLGQHLQTIRRTETHLIDVKEIMERIKTASG